MRHAEGSGPFSEKDQYPESTTPENPCGSAESRFLSLHDPRFLP
jgi:hypothetical protein